MLSRRSNPVADAVAAEMAPHRAFTVLSCGRWHPRDRNSSEEVRMDRRTRWIAGGAVALAVVGGGTGIAIATGAADDDEPLTGSALEQATQAALEHTGGGTVIETEAGDDGAGYGVEVRLEDGRVVEVNLDQNFNVIGDEADDDGTNDQDGPDDD
jgi:Peptidase propeptide and YPEB domain